MLSSPVPTEAAAGSNPGPSSLTAKRSCGLVAVDDESHVNPSTTVLERVLQRLREAEVHGSLHVGIEAPGGADLDGRIPRERGHGVSQGRAEATVLQRRGVDAAGEVAQLDAGAAELIAELVEPRAERRVNTGRVLTQVGELDLRRDERLLGAVVEIPLDAAPLALAGCHDACPRHARRATTFSASTVALVKAMIETIVAMNGMKKITTPDSSHQGRTSRKPVTSCSEPRAATPRAVTNEAAHVAMELAPRDVGHRQHRREHRGEKQDRHRERSDRRRRQGNQVVGDGEGGDDTVGSAGAQRSISARHDQPGCGNHRREHQEVAGCDDEDVGAEQHHDTHGGGRDVDAEQPGEPTVVPHLHVTTRRRVRRRQVQQHGAHPPMGLPVVHQPELGEDRVDVLLHGVLADEQRRRHGGVVLAGGHLVENLALA